MSVAIWCCVTGSEKLFPQYRHQFEPHYKPRSTVGEEQLGVKLCIRSQPLLHCLQETALLSFLRSPEHFLANDTRKTSSVNAALMLPCRECPLSFVRQSPWFSTRDGGWKINSTETGDEVTKLL